MKKKKKWNEGTHSSCPLGIHDSVPFSFNGAERLFVVWWTEREKHKNWLTFFTQTLSVGPNLKPLNWDINRATISLLQNLSGDPVLLPAVEGFGVEHDVRAVARLGAGDVALPAELHPRYSQNWPGRTSSGSAKGTLLSVSLGGDTDRIKSAG